MKYDYQKNPRKTCTQLSYSAKRWVRSKTHLKDVTRMSNRRLRRKNHKCESIYADPEEMVEPVHKRDSEETALFTKLW